MTVVRRPFWNLATALSLLVLLPSAARAVAWMDDFNDGNVTDGNPVTWIEDLGGSGNFPGTYDASSGDYHLIDPTGPSEQMISLVPTSFNDVYMRTQGVILPGALPEQDAGNLALLARVDTATLSAYTVYFDTEFNLGLQVLAGGDDLVDINVDIPFSAVSEVVLEFNVVGNALSAFVWEVGQPKPAEPQITYIDESNLLTSGLVGIGADDEGEDTTAVYRFVAAQDTPFVDIDPSNGDFDGDSDVDGEDFLIWQRGLGLTGQPNASTGDADGDGDVDAADLGLWQANFGGAPMVAAIAAVPEPATCSSAAAALLALAVLRRRNN
jgi:hypothetical protein